MTKNVKQCTNIPPSTALVLSDPEKNPPNASRSPGTSLSSFGILGSIFNESSSPTSGVCNKSKDKCVVELKLNNQ